MAAAERSVGHDHTEIEWQLATADLDSVQRWINEHRVFDGLVVEPRSPVEVHDTYFDTSDWRIQRAGFALRVRSAGGESEATLKELLPSKEGIADRREVTEPLPDAAPEALVRSSGPVGSRVHAVIGPQSLRTLFDVRTARQRFAIRRQEDSKDVGEIALDRTVIGRPDGEPQTSLQRVEVEALAGETQPLEGLVKALSGECSLQKTTDSKYALGLKAIGLAAPVSTFGPDRAEDCMSARDASLASLRRHLSAWLLHEPGARLGEDPEELHDLRVATRRISATIALFKEHLPAALVRMRGRLARVLDALGNVRDLDVLLMHLDAHQRDVTAVDHGSLEPLRRLVEVERSRSRVRMLRVLDAAPTQKALARLRDTLLIPPRAGAAQRRNESILSVAPLLLRSRYKKMRKAADALTRDSSVEDYHAVRGRIKKLRYAVEAVAALYGKPADEFVRLLRRVQEQLGAQQDAEITLAQLQTLNQGRGLPTQAAFEMGRMAERQAAAGLRARDEYNRERHKLRKRWKKLRRRFDERNVPAQETTESVSPARTRSARPPRRRA